MKLILDTDIGTDVDDCLALALLLASPEIDLIGITCVYGDTVLRGRIAHKLLALRGSGAIPVVAGAVRPLLGLRPVYWEGHEGAGLLTDADPPAPLTPGFAPDWIVQQARALPGQVHLAAIGPLTNVALALLQEPALPQLLAGVTVMGGVTRGGSDLHLPPAEHNILCDPDAAHIVFSSGLKITVMPLNITAQTEITQAGLARIRAAGTPFHTAVADQLARYPRFAAQGWTSPHDPLALVALLHPEWCEWTRVTVEVETASRVAAGVVLPRADAQGSTTWITAVNIPACEAFLLARLEA